MVSESKFSCHDMPLYRVSVVLMSASFGLGLLWHVVYPLFCRRLGSAHLRAKPLWMVDAFVARCRVLGLTVVTFAALLCFVMLVESFEFLVQAWFAFVLSCGCVLNLFCHVECVAWFLVKLSLCWLCWKDGCTFHNRHIGCIDKWQCITNNYLYIKAACGQTVRHSEAQSQGEWAVGQREMQQSEA